ncbi:uncharacterized protein LOC107467881 [Arachis duranensis]|uniref:Uncharacterized protein LOC107467881 n=1 Tax=Arachis duranensis TaxID=130453 RepID=A0A6P4C7W2_ARADU|nr:uncharacterized protein LOC107467881 [Arachis duranensis]XP_057735723.1 uncharacterized protein LOC130951126 [Arachis stenosperma]
MAANSFQQQKQSHGNKVVPKQQCSSRRTPSFSSSSSSSVESSSFYYFHDDHNKILLSPASPLRFSGGVPFSWEHLPGIPKKQSSKRIPSSPSSMKLLPLMPPPTKHGSHDQEASRIRKKNSSFQKDPFLAALVECSKEDQDEETRTRNRNLWSGPKVSRSISDRFGFTDIYGSCKRTCAVSESIVYLPSSSSSSSSSSSRRRTL